MKKVNLIHNIYHKLERETVKSQFDVINNSNSSAADLQSAITQLRNIRDNQIKSEIVTTEINEKIEKAKVAIVASKKAAEVKVATAK